MKMIILPQLAAEEISKEINIKTSIISITGPDEDDVKFAKNENIDKIFRMRFNDIEHDLEMNGIKYQAPVQSDFTGLKAFVDNLDCELLVIHCGAGVSRSAAVGAAINEYLNLGYQIFNNPNFFPNMTVYSCCMEELGIAKTKEYYEKIFAEHAQIYDNKYLPEDFEL